MQALCLQSLKALLDLDLTIMLTRAIWLQLAEFVFGITPPKQFTLDYVRR